MAGSNSTVRVGFLGDASQLAREAERARHSLAGVEKQSHTLSTALGATLGTAAGLGIGSIVGAAGDAARAMVAFAGDSIGAASDLNESISKSQAVFGASTSAVKAWADDSSKNILLTKQAATEGAATFGNLFVAMGLGQAPAAGLSTSLVGLAEDLSSFNNVGTDQALEALRSGLLGEAEPLRQFGVNLSQVRIEAEAYALGLAKPVKNAAAIQSANVAVAAATANVTKVQKEHGKGTLAAAVAQDRLSKANAGLAKAMAGQKVTLTAAQKAQAAYSLILKDTTTAQGDAARTSGGYANSTRILHKHIGDLQASIGQKLLPYALHATQQMSKLVEEFDKGTGTGGRLRDDLGKLAGEARDVGDVLNHTVVPAVKFFVEHPQAFKLAAEGMAAYAMASKAAAIWNARLAATEALPTVVAALGGVGKTAPAAAEGITAVGAASKLAFPEVAALAAAALTAYEMYKQLKSISGGTEGGDAKHLGYSDNTTPGSSPAYPGLYDPNNMLPPIDPDRGHIDEGKHSLANRGSVAKIAADKAAAAVKASADKTAAAQKYAADQAEKAAKAKAAAADALQKATDKLREALASRVDEARGIRDNLVNANSVVRDGVSWTAKDLLSRFTVTMAKVKRFQAAISALVHKGYSQEIVQQVAAAGVQGGMGTAVGLAHASAAQVAKFNAAQQGIGRAAGAAGSSVAGMQGRIQITSVLKVDSRELARAVNEWNARNGFNGHQLAS